MEAEEPAPVEERRYEGIKMESQEPVTSTSDEEAPAAKESSSQKDQDFLDDEGEKK
jgi:hypothetical protein